jgi:hypothetical protein
MLFKGQWFCCPYQGKTARFAVTGIILSAVMFLASLFCKNGLQKTLSPIFLA